MSAFAERYADWMNDQRRARWAAKYYAHGYHRRGPVADCPQPDYPLREPATRVAAARLRAPAPDASRHHEELT